MMGNICELNLPRTVSRDGAEKRAILERLRAYRSAHGPGCLDAVAKAARSPKTIDAMALRDVLLGRAVLDIKDWRRIARALDRLDQEEREEAEFMDKVRALREGAK